MLFLFDTFYFFYQADDEVRKWTEKKKRSKSLPRGSEIDEIVGSSKTKSSNSRFFQAPGIQAAQNLMTTVTGVSNSSSSTTSVRRHSRVELYENDRKQQRKQAAKFSLKKFFKMGLVNNSYGMQFPSVRPTDTSPHSNKCENQVQFLDKEHEREIVEREQSKAKCRPEIIHPLDLQRNMMSNVPLVAGADYLNGGSTLSGGAPNIFPTVDLVKITPKSTISPSMNKVPFQNKLVNSNTVNNKGLNGHYEKNIYNGNNRTAGVNKAGVNKSIIAKGKLESYNNINASSIVDTSSKNDSGHETSSIHTENSEGSSSSSVMFSSAYGGSAGSGEDANVRFAKDNIQTNEKSNKENGSNSFYNDNFIHSRSSSTSETTNSFSIASSCMSASTPFNVQQVKKQRAPYISEIANSSSTPPSSNSETGGQYARYHQSSNAKVSLGVNRFPLFLHYSLLHHRNYLTDTKINLY